MKLTTALHSGVLAIALSGGFAFGQMTVLNSASYDSKGPLAPGSFATIFGKNLCGQTVAGQLDSNGMYPITLGGCSLTVNGTAAPIQYATAGQINFVVPQSAGSGTAGVVINNGTEMLTGSMMIGPAGPGVFSLDGTGMGNGAMLLSTTWRMGPFSPTTNGQSTPVTIFMTGMDLSSAKPVVSVAGISADVTFFGNTPGNPGLQQVNMMLPANTAGVGRVPVTVTSNGQTSNVTFMTILPTTGMMQGMPGWNSGMMIGENMRRGAEMSSVAVNAVNNSALVTDEAGDSLRVISLNSKTTVATISLPDGSQAGSVVVNPSGTLAAVALIGKGSIALIDLTKNQVASVIGTGYYASRLAFVGTNLLVSNGASGTVAVIDTNARQVTRVVSVGFGPGGIAAAGNLAVVANMQGGSISIINLTDFSVTNVSLPAGSRPAEVAISTAGNKALITNPMSNRAFILSLDSREVKTVELAPFSGMGPGGVAANGTLAFVANQMGGTILVIDLNTGSVVKSFAVDPGPRSLAVNPVTNQILVLCQGTGTLDMVDLTTYGLTARINAASGNSSGSWTLPSITSITPNTAKIGSSSSVIVNGSNFQGVTGLEFRAVSERGGGMMGSGMPIGADSNIKVTNLSVNSAGTQVTASVQILSLAAAGSRQIRLETNHGEMMGQMSSTVFTVTR